MPFWEMHYSGYNWSAIKTPLTVRTQNDRHIARIPGLCHRNGLPCREITLSYFQTGLVADSKRDGSPVTLADRSAEEMIRSRIEKAYPSHAIVGEEFGVQETAGASHRWLIDPIDGTKSFVAGVPLYSVLLGLEIEGRVEVGVIYLPALNELVAAATGHGCWWNGRRARVSQVSRIDRLLQLSLKSEISENTAVGTLSSA
jgi:fructose-1,6-bisphosphatase/inositol monophosphatase family enzyme